MISSAVELTEHIFHKPVMLSAVINALSPESGDIIVDGTIGEAGHSEQIVKKIGDKGYLIGLDKDPVCAKIAERRLKDSGPKIDIICTSYVNIIDVLKERGINSVNGVLLDLGFSKRHIDGSGKGFSFNREEPLDMRYNTASGVPAYDWINNAQEKDIEAVLRCYGQESQSRRIAMSIIRYRERKTIKSSKELAKIVAGTKKGRARIHPATKTFQAIRIFINNELDELKIGLENALQVLISRGVLAVLTYHSLEDKIVKSIMRKFSGECSCPSNFPVCVCKADKIKPRIKLLKSSGSAPDEFEVENNPSARSAHLRVCMVV